MHGGVSLRKRLILLLGFLIILGFLRTPSLLAAPQCHCTAEIEWIMDFTESQTSITMKVTIHPETTWNSWWFHLRPSTAYGDFVAYSAPANDPLPVRVSTEGSGAKVTVPFGGNKHDGYTFELRFVDRHQPRIKNSMLETGWDWTESGDVAHSFHLWLPEGYSVSSLNVPDYSTETRRGRDHVSFARWGASNQKLYWNLVAGYATFRISIGTTDWTSAATGSRGIPITVDGTMYESWQLPRDFTWKYGSLHAVDVEEIVSGGSGVRHLFVGWNDGSKVTHREVRITGPLTLLADYKTQFELVASSPLGEPVGSGWYDAEHVATVRIVDLFLLVFVFRGWTGSISSSNSTERILMDGPKTIQAVWTVDYFRSLLLVGAVGIVLSVSIHLTYKKSTKKGPKGEPEGEAVGGPEDVPARELGDDQYKLQAPQLPTHDADKYSQYLTRLEELRTSGAIPEDSYLKLKDEYRKKLEQQT